MIGVITAIEAHDRSRTWSTEANIMNYELTIELGHDQKLVLIMSKEETANHAVGQHCDVHVKWA